MSGLRIAADKARFAVQQNFDNFISRAPQLRIPLTVPDMDLEMLQAGITAAEDELQSYESGGIPRSEVTG